MAESERRREYLGEFGERVIRRGEYGSKPVLRGEYAPHSPFARVEQEISPAGVGVLERLNRRETEKPRSQSVLGVYEGTQNRMAQFSTNEGDTVSVPVENVITRRSWEGTFVITRTNENYPFAYK